MTVIFNFLNVFYAKCFRLTLLNIYKEKAKKTPISTLHNTIRFLKDTYNT